MCKKVADPLDAPPLVVGIFTLLKQFHSENTNFYLAFLAQYVRSIVDTMGRWVHACFGRGSDACVWFCCVSWGSSARMGWGAVTWRSGLGTLFGLSGWGTRAVTESDYGSSKAGFLIQCPGLILTWVVVIVCSYRVYPLSDCDGCVCLCLVCHLFFFFLLFLIYNCNGWLGVKHRVTTTLFFFSFLVW